MFFQILVNLLSLFTTIMYEKSANRILIKHSMHLLPFKSAYKLFSSKYRNEIDDYLQQKRIFFPIEIILFAFERQAATNRSHIPFMFQLLLELSFPLLGKIDNIELVHFIVASQNIRN